MGYDLMPFNKELKSFSPGIFTWPIMLKDTGMGYILGYGEGRIPGTYVYIDGNNGSPTSNDGYKVSATEAKMMAKVGRGYLIVQRHVNKQWDEIDPEIRRIEENAKSLDDGKPLYRKYVHEDYLKKIEAFCDFAEKSKGFKIR
jgi:hypothetical protein